MHSQFAASVAGIVLSCASLFSASAFADSFKLKPQKSVFAAITHKAGLASGLAHNHVVVATSPQVEFGYENAKIEEARFSIQIRTDKLEVDEPQMQTRVGTRMKELGIWSEVPAMIPEGDREKIREAMVEKGQLNVKEFPRITGKLHSLKPQESKLGSETFTHMATIDVEIKGKQVKRDIPVKIVKQNDVMVAEAVGSFKFTEFGIKPYSAFLGAVKNQDGFHLYVRLEAEKL